MLAAGGVAAIRPALSNRRVHSEGTGRRSRAGAPSQRGLEHLAPGFVRRVRHGPPRTRRSQRSGSHPRASRVGRTASPARGYVLSCQLWPSAGRLRRRLLRIPVVQGLRPRHVQPFHRKRRDQSGGRAADTAGRFSNRAGRSMVTSCSATFWVVSLPMRPSCITSASPSRRPNRAVPLRVSPFLTLP